ncbi:MAG: prepilin-type N-terminal cleavage/methylation domain-containing protein [Candidatus Eisenbacteria bacterium]|nr:prepilin-type N-terminal cleavage/methylation domain-containing protein [Candidatus Eisenbacteria bacterium]
MKRLSLQRGFTLMELMVVIVIVAILAAVAVPLYINYVNDARRTEAKGAIGAVITAQQVYFQQNNTYANDVTALKVDLTDMVPRWTITVPTGTATAFSVHAVQVGGPLVQDYTYDRTTGVATWTPN